MPHLLPTIPMMSKKLILMLLNGFWRPREEQLHFAENIQVKNRQVLHIGILAAGELSLHHTMIHSGVSYTFLVPHRVEGT